MKTKTEELTFAQLFEVFKGNVTKGMLECLANELGVTVKAIETLGVGYYPGQYCWIFAERDADGEIIGLVRRYHNNEKWSMEGSKRGLIYAYNSDHEVGDKRYDAGKCQWINIQDQANLVCPICGRTRWCMVSPDNPEDPSAVICNRISQGSVREMPGGGYLHIRKQQSNGTSHSVLINTELPILIVEGASDVLAAMSMGFVAIGRPSTLGGMTLLKEMPLVSKEVWVIGENDMKCGSTGVPSYPGKEGMEKAYINLKTVVENVKAFLPPKEIKDLRQWFQRGVTPGDLYTYAGEHDDSVAINSDIFPDKNPATVTQAFMDEFYMSDEKIPLLKRYRKHWIRWGGTQYENISDEKFRGDIHRFLLGKKYQKKTTKGIEIKPYGDTRANVLDIIDALTMFCPIDENKKLPCWLDGREHPDPNDLIVFQNGMLNINEYVKGDIVLRPLTPLLFTRNAFPYDFDPDAKSPEFEKTCDDWFNNDEECIRLLHQWMGYNIIPDMSQEKLMVFKGDPRSGKGTVLKILQSMLGGNNTCSTSFQALADKFGASNAEGKLAIIVPDDSKTRNVDINAAISKILAISGWDVVSLQAKFGQEHDADLICRFTIALNNFPKFDDSPGAFEARALLLGFPNSYRGRENFDLKGLLTKEAAEGKIINYALRGLKDLREQGKFILPESSEPLLEELRNIVSLETSFCKNCIVENKGKWVFLSMIYAGWEHWCEKTRCAPGTIDTVGRWMHKQFPDLIKFRPVNPDTGKQEYAYKDIDLAPWIYNVLGRPGHTTMGGGV